MRNNQISKPSTAEQFFQNISEYKYKRHTALEDQEAVCKGMQRFMKSFLGGWALLKENIFAGAASLVLPEKNLAYAICEKGFASDLAQAGKISGLLFGFEKYDPRTGRGLQIRRLEGDNSLIKMSTFRSVYDG
jgi:hypothetical protein